MQSLFSRLMHIKSLTEIMQNPSAAVDAIQRFRLITSVRRPEQHEQAGWITNLEITPEQFATICSRYADGIEYVQKRFGYTPGNIAISDAPAAGGNVGIRYNAEADTIYIPREHIANNIKIPTRAQGKTDPMLLKSADMAFLYGVEEAYHGYQFKAHPQREIFANAVRHNPDGSYNHDNILEQDAERVVREAMVEYGLHKGPVRSETPQYPISQKAREWYQQVNATPAQWTSTVNSPARAATAIIR